MKEMNHENIIKLFEVIDDPSSDKLYLIMPVAELGEIMQWKSGEDSFEINRKLQFQDYKKASKPFTMDKTFYSEEVIRQFAWQLISALDYLHNEVRIVHRDIKP